MPSPETERRSPRRLPWEAAALVASAVLALMFQGWLPSALPSDNDHTAIGSWLTAHAQPGDVVLLHPWWSERARLFAPDSLAVVGYLGSDSDDLEDFPRVWVLSQPRLPASRQSDFERAFLPGRARLEGPERRGPLELSLYTNGRYRPALFRASDSLSEALVSIEQPTGQRVACPRQTDGEFLCPNRTRVGVGWHELKYRPFRCIALEPPGGEAKLILSFPQVPAAPSLLLEAGIIWEHAAKRDPGMTPLQVELRAPGVESKLANLQVPVGREGMQRVELPGRASGALEVAVSSARREHREACVQLLAVAAAGGSR